MHRQTRHLSGLLTIGLLAGCDSDSQAEPPARKLQGNHLPSARYRQLVEYAREYNADFNDGWDLFTLLSLLDRNFCEARSQWNSFKSQFGFDTYISYPSTMDEHDFLVIATSFIIGRDMRPFFDQCGMTYSAMASGQVQSYGYAPVAKLAAHGPNQTQLRSSLKRSATQLLNHEQN